MSGESWREITPVKLQVASDGTTKSLTKVSSREKLLKGAHLTFDGVAQDGHMSRLVTVLCKDDWIARLRQADARQQFNHLQIRACHGRTRTNGNQ